MRLLAQLYPAVQSQFGIGADQIDALFKYGKELYECGAYAPALDMLDNFSQFSLDAGRIVAADWGKLACYILTQQVRHFVPKVAASLSVGRRVSADWLASWCSRHEHCSLVCEDMIMIG